ncbi:MAG: phage tail tape measure protein [Chloroflexi bacterium]|nr:MAG: phage tail tape measure protein [Chloroflexota bacterium]
MVGEDLVVKVGADISSYERAMSKVSGIASSGFGAITKYAKVATGALAGFATWSAKTGMDFEKALTEVATVAQATAQEVKTLEQTARQLGATTAYSATEAARGMYALASAGMSAREITEATGHALKFAGATASTMEQATNLLASTLQQFNLDASESQRVMDVYAQAITNSMLTTEKLTEAMKYAGTVGAGFGWTLEETTAAVAMFANLGLEGSMAGTNLRMSMLALTNATEKGREALAKYNLTLEDISPTTHNFAEIIKKVGEVSMTTEDAVRIFGQRAGANIAQLGRLYREGAIDIEEFTHVLEDSLGRSDEMYSQFMDTVWGRWKTFQSAFEELRIKFFDVMEKDLTDLFENLTKGVQAFSEWLERNKTVIQDWTSAVGEAVMTAAKFADYLFGISNKARIMELEDEISKLTKQQKDLHEVLKLQLGTAETQRKAAEAYIEVTRELKKKKEELQKLYEKEYINLENNTKATKELSDKTKELSERTKEQSEKTKELTTNLDDSQNELKEFINTWKDFGKTQADKLREAIAFAEEYKEELIALGFNWDEVVEKMKEKLQELTEANEEAVDVIEEQYINMGDTILDAFSEVIVGIMRGTRDVKDLFGGLKDAIIGSFAEAFAEALKEKLKFDLTMKKNFLQDLPGVVGQGLGVIGGMFGSLFQGVGSILSAVPGLSPIGAGISAVGGMMLPGGTTSFLGVPFGAGWLVSPSEFSAITSGQAMWNFPGAGYVSQIPYIGEPLTRFIGSYGLYGVPFLMQGLTTGDWASAGGSFAGGAIGSTIGAFIPVPGASLVLGGLGSIFGGGLFGKDHTYRRKRRGAFWTQELENFATATSWEEMIRYATEYPIYFGGRGSYWGPYGTGTLTPFTPENIPHSMYPGWESGLKIQHAGYHYTPLEGAMPEEDYWQTIAYWDDIAIHALNSLDAQKTATLETAKVLGDYRDEIEKTIELMPTWGEEAQDYAEAMLQMYDNMVMMTAEDLFDKYAQGQWTIAEATKAVVEGTLTWEEAIKAVNEGLVTWEEYMQALADMGFTPVEQNMLATNQLMDELLNNVDLNSDMLMELYGRLQETTQALDEYNQMTQDMTNIQNILTSGMDLTEDQLKALITYYREINKALEEGVEDWDEFFEIQQQAYDVMTDLVVGTNELAEAFKTLVETTDLSDKNLLDLYVNLQDLVKEQQDYNQMIQDMTDIQNILLSGMDLTGEQLHALVAYYQALQDAINGNIEDWDEFFEIQDEGKEVLDEIIHKVDRLKQEAAELQQEAAELNEQLKGLYENLEAIGQVQERVRADIFTVSTYGETPGQRYARVRAEWRAAGQAWEGVAGAGTYEEQISALETLRQATMNWFQAQIDWTNYHYDQLIEAENERHSQVMANYEKELKAIQQNRAELERRLTAQQQVVRNLDIARRELLSDINGLVTSMRLAALTPEERFSELRRQIISRAAAIPSLKPKEQVAAIQNLLSDYQTLQRLALQLYGEGSEEALAATEEIIEGILELRDQSDKAYQSLISSAQSQVALLQMQIDMLRGQEDSILRDMREENQKYQETITKLNEERNTALNAIKRDAIEQLKSIDKELEKLKGAIESDIGTVESKLEEIKIELQSINENIESLLAGINTTPETTTPEGEFQTGGRVPKSGSYRLEEGEVVLPITGSKPLGVPEETTYQVVVLPMFYRDIDKSTIEKYVKEDVIPVIEKESRRRGKPFIYDRALKKSYRGAA